MRVRELFSQNKQIINKQSIINYQYQMIEQTIPEVKPTISNANKYTSWQLQAKIKNILGEQQHIVRWVGNNDCSYLQTYSYILLIGAGYSKDNLLEFKNIVYKIGRQCLSKAEQKLLVQFLCLIEYSRDRYSFLNKYPQVQMIFIKMLQYIDEEHSNSDDSILESANKNKAKVKRKNSIIKSKQTQLSFSHKFKQNRSNKQNSVSIQLQTYKQLEQIYQFFNKYFSFITIQSSNQYSCTLKLFNKTTIYVIIQKQCYFVVQTCNQSNKLSVNHQQTSILDTVLQKDNLSMATKRQFQNLFLNKNQVQVSNVIAVERGSQIRKTSTELILNSFYTLQHLNQRRRKQSIKAHLAQNNLQSIQNLDKKETQTTFINELVKNIDEHNSKQSSKENKNQQANKYHTPKRTKQNPLKRQLVQKMKGILEIKQGLKKVRQDIENKIKILDHNKKIKNTNRSSQNIVKINSSQNKIKMKSRDSKNSNDIILKKANIVQQQIIKKFYYRDPKKQRKASYNSAGVFHFHGQNANLYQNQEQSQQKTKIRILNHERMQKILSEKAVSRPQSMIRSLQQNPPQKNITSFGKANNYLKAYASNNVNVNVNVNINENSNNPFKKQPLNIRNKNLVMNYKGPTSPKRPPIMTKKQDENRFNKRPTVRKQSFEVWMKNTKVVPILAK